MSSIGYRQAELEKQRKEQLRLQQLRNRARGLLGACKGAIAAINDPAVQQVVAKDLKEVQQELDPSN